MTKIKSINQFINLFKTKDTRSAYITIALKVKTLKTVLRTNSSGYVMVHYIDGSSTIISIDTSLLHALYSRNFVDDFTFEPCSSIRGENNRGLVRYTNHVQYKINIEEVIKYGERKNVSRNM